MLIFIEGPIYFRFGQRDVMVLIVHYISPRLGSKRPSPMRAYEPQIRAKVELSYWSTVHPKVVLEWGRVGQTARTRKTPHPPGRLGAKVGLQTVGPKLE